MKRLLLTIVSCFCLACSVLLGACSFSSVNGTYKLQKIKYTQGDTQLTVNLGDKYEGLQLKEDTFILIIESDYAIFREHSVEIYNGEMSENTYAHILRWVKGYANEMYFISEDEETFIAIKNGKEISMEIEDGITLYFSK